jgi:hypothetical protein
LLQTADFPRLVLHDTFELHDVIDKRPAQLIGFLPLNQTVLMRGLCSFKVMLGCAQLILF